MGDFNKRKEIQTKKAHDCLGCLTEIPVGSGATYHSGKTEEGFYGYYLCPDCDQYLEENGKRIGHKVWKNCVTEMKIRQHLYG